MTHRKCWNCGQPATHTMTREGSITLHACDNCTRIDREEAESRGWTVADTCSVCGKEDCANEVCGTERPRRDAPARRPRDAEHVQIVEEGNIVIAVYIPDPEQAKDPKAVLDAPPTIDSVWEIEVVAEATRFYKRDGADFSGWVVRSRQDYTDSIPNKREAMQALRDAINQYFEL